MANTLLSNLINPQVMADMMDKKLTDLIRFSPLAEIDTTLVGNPGDTLTLPSWNYIGDASVLSEGSSITYATLSATSTSVTVVKGVSGVRISDEAVLSGYGDPVGESVNQIALAIAGLVDNKCLTALGNIPSTMTMETTATTVAPKDTDIQDALEKFGEDIDGLKVAIVPPAVYTLMRKNTNSWIPASEMASGIAIKGAVGEYGGCQVIVSNKLKTSGDIYIVKPGALRISLKRDTLIETERDLDYFCTKIAGSKHFVAYLYDSTKAIRIKKKA